jgi:Tol biopolymer transport system component
VAFDSDRSGQPQIYVQPLAGEGDQVQVSQDGCTEPVWGPNGSLPPLAPSGGPPAQLGVPPVDSVYFNVR